MIIVDSQWGDAVETVHVWRMYVLCSYSWLGHQMTTYKFSCAAVFGVMLTGVDRADSLPTAVGPKPKKRFC